MKRNLQLLNGWWDYRIGDGEFFKKRVPYSDAPVGFAECRLSFDAEHQTHDKRAFLVFDGITYSADVTFNGKCLGTMRPYCEYRYEITELIKENGNLLEVTVRDTDVVFGPAEGWENYSGIIRDVYIEYTEKNIIDSVFWHTELSDDYQNAVCTVEIVLDEKNANANKNSSARVILTDPSGRAVYDFPVELDPCIDKTEASFTCDRPLLWTPDTPHLYTLKVELYCDGKVSDSRECRIGFKHLYVKGKRFYLNGEPIFFLGVCRHDLFGDQGHVMSEEQMYTDMRMIKDTGANYVRLVHYPHHKKILDIADELGLFVSEEPGLWWSDVKNEELYNGSLEVLRRTVLRDRNHVSVAFWLSFNECIFTPEYLRAAADLCRSNDPYHMVSGANCMDVEMTKKHFAECGLDFYTMHPYTYDPYWMVKLAQMLDDKPLFFTEWGGLHVYDNPNFFKTCADTIVSLWHNPDEGPVVTGASIWCWAGVYEFNRAAPACFNGLLCEGLVDNYRRPNLCYDIYKKYFAKIKNPKPIKKYIYKSEFCAQDGDYTAVSLEDMVNTPEQNAAWDAMMAHAKEPIERFHWDARKLRIMKNGPVLPEKVMGLGSLPVDLSSKPFVIRKDSPLMLDIGKKADEIFIIGNSSMPKGFPIGGEYGEDVAILEVTYTDGATQAVVLQNGREITTAAGWYGPSRINPVASHAPRAIRFINDMDREHYVTNLFSVTTDPDKTVDKLCVRVVAEGYDILTYGVTLYSK